MCDSFCSGLKITKDYPDEMWEFIVPYVQSDKEYGIRFGVVMILFYYVDSVHMEEAFRLLDVVQYDSYYEDGSCLGGLDLLLKLPEGNACILVRMLSG